MKRLIIYAGPNGAGKSSLRDIVGDTIEVVIDPDRIARNLSANNPQLAQFDAGRIALKLFHESISRGESISLETTLTGQTVLNRMVEARQAGYQIELRFIALPDCNDHIARVAQRVSQGGHHIPAETIARRYERSLDNLPEALCIAHTGIVIDNSGIERRTLVQTAARKIVYQDPQLPAWLRMRLPLIKRLLGT